MIEEGEVEVDRQVLGAGKTFNLSGFLREQPSEETCLTRSFTSVWVISQYDLDEIGRNSVNLKAKISKRYTEDQKRI